MTRGEEAFGGSVPSCGDVFGVGGFGVDSATGTKVGEFEGGGEAEEDVFGFDVAVEYSFTRRRKAS